MSYELVQRSFVGDITDAKEQDHEVTMFFDQRDFPDGSTETTGEDFELEDQWVSYADLVVKFGKQRTDQFIERATQHAR